MGNDLAQVAATHRIRRDHTGPADTVWIEPAHRGPAYLGQPTIKADVPMPVDDEAGLSAGRRLEYHCRSYVPFFCLRGETKGFSNRGQRNLLQSAFTDRNYTMELANDRERPVQPKFHAVFGPSGGLPKALP